MVRIKQKGIKALYEHIIESYTEDEYFYIFSIDQELVVTDICEFIYKHLNRRLNALDLYLEKSNVTFGENNDFEISDKSIKELTEKFNAKLEIPTSKNDLESLFGEIDETLTMKDVAKFFARQIERIVRFNFEFDYFERYIDY